MVSGQRISKAHREKEEIVPAEYNSAGLPGFNNNKRLRELAEFFEVNHLQSELKLRRLDMKNSNAN
jgi:hypothetical protein